MKKGFTLAEVLITLGIIGIVASMTLPSIINDYRDKETVTEVRKTYSDIYNAINNARISDGNINDNSVLFNPENSSTQTAQNFIKYFNGAKLCPNNKKECKKYYYDIKYATLRVDTNNSGIVNTSNNDPKIIFSNGAILRISTNKSGCASKEYTSTVVDEYGKPVKNPDGTNKTYTYTSTICANLFFDVNGNKQPNQFGRDAYWLWIYKNKVAPGTDNHVGGKSFKNILTGKDKLEYENYSKGQSFEF